MTKKPETVKEEDLIKRKDGLVYKKYARVPFTGISEEFWKNGQLKSKETYKKGKLRGPYTVFHENGQKKLEATYKYKNSVLDGGITIYHENGGTFQQAQLNREIICGTFLEEDEDGNLVKYRDYLGGAYMGYFDEEEEEVKNPDWDKPMVEAEGYYDENEEILVASPHRSEDEKKVIDMINKLWW